MEGLCRVLKLRAVGYSEACALQKKLVEERAAGVIPDTLVILEHPPVFTVGRAGGREDILAPGPVLEREGIVVHQADRGGGVTYHGPGQLVGYPILDLRQHGKDLHSLLYR